MGRARTTSNPFAKLLGALFPTSDNASGNSDLAAGSVTKQAVPSGDGSTETSDGGLQTVIGGEANAVGESTSASGSVFTRTVDKGPVTISFGVAKFSAAAQSPQSEPTYAAADSYADASGADLFLTRTHVKTGGGENADQTFSTQTSRTTYLAIDFENHDLPRGPLAISQTVEHRAQDKAIPSDGNVATVGVDAQATAAHTNLGIDVSALTIEDRLSTVSATVVTEVA